MKPIIEKIVKMVEILKKNETAKVTEWQEYESPANKAQLDEFEASKKIEKSVLEFYRFSDGFELKWEAKKDVLKENDIIGQIKIQPMQKVIISWKGIVYFDDEPEDSPLRKFFLIDFFADEAAVGFSSAEGWRNSLYLYKFDQELIPLHINFEGYLRLLLLTGGCLYWQYLIIELLEGKENPVSARIKKYLPEILPDFNFESFGETYNKLKIKS